MRAAILLAVMAVLAGPARADDDHKTFSNPVLGYRVRLPEGNWVFVRNPPFPLADLVVYSADDDATLVVRVDETGETPEPSADLAGAQEAAAAFQTEIESDHEAVADLEVRFEPFAGLPAYHISLSAAARAGGGRFHVTRRPFIKNGFLFRIDTRRGADAIESTVLGLERAEASFAVYDPDERDGELYAPTGEFFRIRIGPEWWVAAAPEGDGKRFRLRGPDDAYVEIDVRPFRESGWSKAVASERLAALLAADVPGAQIGAALAANEKECVTYRVDYRHGSRRGYAWALVRNARLYRVRAEGPEKGPGTEKARGVYEGMEILRDYALDIAPEREAAREDREGVRLYYEGKSERASVHFLRALECFPRDSFALNFLGSIDYDAGRFEDAVGRFRAARHLYPVSRTVTSNYGWALAEAGKAALAADPKDYARARGHFEEAAALSRRFPELAPAIGAGFHSLGFAEIAEKRWTQAQADIAKAIELEDAPTYRRNFAIACYNEAAELATHGSFPRAKAKLREALAMCPDFPEAKAVLAELEGK
ncbi:MAG: tetratricopeptide repeat protein [Planctomycetes bacterium]|nr:tetratricopeptide repeat protein [Planctomycetota bacterium]